MSSAVPEPEPKVAAGLWTIFRIAVWVLIALWINPRFLDWVGGEGVARWLMDHRWVWWLGVPPLGLLALISSIEFRDDRTQRAARQELASTTGGTVVELRGIDPTLGVATGPGLGVPLGRWSMEVGTWRRQRTSHTVASVRVESRTGLSFVAHGAGREPVLLRGLQQFAMRAAVRQIAKRADDPLAAAAAATVGYLAESPIAMRNEALDRAVVLRANHPDAARALFTSRNVACAIAALDAKTRRWEWTLYPAESPSMADMRLEFPGALSDPDSLSIVRALLSAALEELADAGVIAA